MAQQFSTKPSSVFDSRMQKVESASRESDDSKGAWAQPFPAFGIPSVHDRIDGIEDVGSYGSRDLAHIRARRGEGLGSVSRAP